MGRITQKEFVAAVREVGDSAYLGGISYQHPGLFNAGGLAIQIEMRKVSRFLLKLSAAMSFERYEKLTRAVWVASMKAELSKRFLYSTISRIVKTRLALKIVTYQKVSPFLFRLKKKWRLF